MLPFIRRTRKVAGASVSVLSRALANVVFLSISSEFLGAYEFNVLAVGFLYASLASFVVDNGSATRDLSELSRITDQRESRARMLEMVGQKASLMLFTIPIVVALCGYTFNGDVASVAASLLIAQVAFIVMNNAAVMERVNDNHELDAALSGSVLLVSLVGFYVGMTAFGGALSAANTAVLYALTRGGLCGIGALLYFLRLPGRNEQLVQAFVHGARNPFRGWDYGVAYVLGGLYLNIGAIIVSQFPGEQLIGAYIYTERFFYAATMGTVALANVFAPALYKQVRDHGWATVSASLVKLQTSTALSCALATVVTVAAWDDLVSVPGLRVMLRDKNLIVGLCSIVLLRYALVTYQIVVNYASRPSAKIVPVCAACAVFAIGAAPLYAWIGLAGVVLANVVSHMILFLLLRNEAATLLGGALK